MDTVRELGKVGAWLLVGAIAGCSDAGGDMMIMDGTTMAGSTSTNVNGITPGAGGTSTTTMTMTPPTQNAAGAATTTTMAPDNGAPMAMAGAANNPTTTVDPNDPMETGGAPAMAPMEMAGASTGGAGMIDPMPETGGAGVGGGGAAGGDTWDTFAQQFMIDYCVECHNDDNAGDSSRDYHILANVMGEADRIACGVAKSQEVWAARGCMAGSPNPRQFPAGGNPSDEERDRLLAWIDAGMP